MAIIDIAVFKGVDAVTVEVAVLKLANVDVARGEGVGAFHGDSTLLPEAGQRVAISPRDRTYDMASQRTIEMEENILRNFRPVIKVARSGGSMKEADSYEAKYSEVRVLGLRKNR